MTENDNDRKAPLKLSPGKLELKKTVETGQVRQSFSHGRSKVVTVEVRKKRTFAQDAGGVLHEVKDGPKLEHHEPAPAPVSPAIAEAEAALRAVAPHLHDLTTGEKATRARALQDALRAEEEHKRLAAEEAVRRAAEEAEAARIAAEEAARIAAEAPAPAEAVAEVATAAAPVAEAKPATPAAAPSGAKPAVVVPTPVAAPAKRKRKTGPSVRAPVPPPISRCRCPSAPSRVAAKAS